MWQQDRQGRGVSQGKRTKEGGRMARERREVSKGVEIQKYGIPVGMEVGHTVTGTTKSWYMRFFLIKIGMAREPGQGRQGERDQML
jgi:hypothetical protein